MSTQEEKNLAVNKFMGWEPNEQCRNECELHRFINYYADTPEARERVRLLAASFVIQDGHEIVMSIKHPAGFSYVTYEVFVVYGERGNIRHENGIESHAILDAIYEAIR